MLTDSMLEELFYLVVFETAEEVIRNGEVTNPVQIEAHETRRKRYEELKKKHAPK